MHQQKTSYSSPRLMASIITFSCLIIGNAASLESDKAQELLWSADGDSRMSIQGGMRLVEMSNNVKITQGTLLIQGDAATIEYSISDNEVRKVTVVGSPVTYQQQLDSSDEPVKGSSNTISFYSDEGDGSTVVELIGEAVIESPSSNLKCSAIVYIADQDLIREAPGPCSGV